MATVRPAHLTASVCPVCGKRIPAFIVPHGADRYMKKNCPEHGAFKTVVWRGEPAMESWGSYTPPRGDAPGCPYSCGLCENHLQDTCCVLVELTRRCNLRCSFCFAHGAEADDSQREKPPDELYDIFRSLVSEGRTFIQLSGGEPTVRDDLPEIIAAARHAGAENIQLNSNGIRLGADRAFMSRCAAAGLDFVFMQFDGLDDTVYEKLRGRPLFKEKRSAIDACGSHGVGVTLVPTVVPGINDGCIGDILRFGLNNSPAVRGVHFQPVSYFGRVPKQPDDAGRITLPEIISAIEKQTDGLIRAADLAPSSCDHPRCGFHGDFVVLDDRVLALTPAPGCCSSKTDGRARANRLFVSRRWKRTDIGAPEPGNDLTDMSTFLARVRRNGFTITAMAFQDPWNIDLERLRRCSLHVWDSGRIIPFCAYYAGFR